MQLTSSLTSGQQRGRKRKGEKADAEGAKGKKAKNENEDKHEAEIKGTEIDSAALKELTVNKEIVQNFNYALRLLRNESKREEAIRIFDNCLKSFNSIYRLSSPHFGFVKNNQPVVSLLIVFLKFAHIYQEYAKTKLGESTEQLNSKSKEAIKKIVGVLKNRFFLKSFELEHSNPHIFANVKKHLEVLTGATIALPAITASISHCSFSMPAVMPIPQPVLSVLPVSVVLDTSLPANPAAHGIDFDSLDSPAASFLPQSFAVDGELPKLSSASSDDEGKVDAVESEWQPFGGVNKSGSDSVMELSAHSVAAEVFFDTEYEPLNLDLDTSSIGDISPQSHEAVQDDEQSLSLNLSREFPASEPNLEDDIFSGAFEGAGRSGKVRSQSDLWDQFSFLNRSRSNSICMSVEPIIPSLDVPQNRFSG